MKYIVILGDGMADRPIKELHGKTPLMVSKKPNIDKLAKLGSVGLISTVPKTLPPGSDVANLSVIGYPPEKYYTGRSPLEALSMGIDMSPSDIAVRCNLVTLSDDGKMQDYSAGEISSGEAAELISAINARLGSEKYVFYAGVSYRHCLIIKNGGNLPALTPPHDITGKDAIGYLPEGELSELILQSGKILKNHPINLERIARGENPATHIWLWGAGKKPNLDDFFKTYGLNGCVISAVDLLKGIAKGAGMDAPDIEGATGTLQTNYKGKASAVIDALKSGKNYVYLHIEAPDECSHQGDLEGKIRAIELVDKTLGLVLDYLEKEDCPFVLSVLPDHSTPLTTQTHGREPVPYLIYRSQEHLDLGIQYNEIDAQRGKFLDSGESLIKEMLQTNNRKTNT
ncbi:MAG: cofactor-independent phosphoglycerate mutase [Clostridia bacterium]